MPTMPARDTRAAAATPAMAAHVPPDRHGLAALLWRFVVIG